MLERVRGCDSPDAALIRLDSPGWGRRLVRARSRDGTLSRFPAVHFSKSHATTERLAPRRPAPLVSSRESKCTGIPATVKGS